MNTFVPGLALIVITATFSHSPTPDDLQALEHYRGSWKSVFTVESGDGGSRTDFTGNVEADWILDGKFLEQTGTYVAANGTGAIKIKTIMTWDPKLKRYRYDYFTSAGGTHRSYGSWEPGSSKMASTMTADESGDTTTIVADFSVPDQETWTIETRNREGKLKTRITGTNKRKKGEGN